MAEPLKALVQEGLEKLCADKVLVNSREDSRNTRARAALADIEAIERRNGIAKAALRQAAEHSAQLQGKEPEEIAEAGDNAELHAVLEEGPDKPPIVLAYEHYNKSSAEQAAVSDDDKKAWSETPHTHTHYASLSEGNAVQITSSTSSCTSSRGSSEGSLRMDCSKFRRSLFHRPTHSSLRQLRTTGFS